MKSQIDKVEFTGHLILTEQQVRVLFQASSYSWDSFFSGCTQTEAKAAQDEFRRETEKLIKKFEAIRAAESGKVIS